MMVKEFNKYAKEMIDELNAIKDNYNRGKYPGEKK